MASRNLGDPPLEISALPSSLWESLNVLLSDKLSSVHGLLGMDAISTSTACRLQYRDAAKPNPYWPVKRATKS